MRGKLDTKKSGHICVFTTFFSNFSKGKKMNPMVCISIVYSSLSSSKALLSGKPNNDCFLCSATLWFCSGPWKQIKLTLWRGVDIRDNSHPNTSILKWPLTFPGPPLPSEVFSPHKSIYRICTLVTMVPHGKALIFLCGVTRGINCSWDALSVYCSTNESLHSLRFFI